MGFQTCFWFWERCERTVVSTQIWDVTSSSNSATVTIEPPLQADLTDNSVVTYNNVSFTVHLENNVQEFGAVGTTKDGDVLYQYEFDVEEAL